MNDGSGSDADDLRDYLYDMMAQLAKVAERCGESGIAMVLHTIVASRKLPPARPDDSGNSSESQPN